MSIAEFRQAVTASAKRYFSQAKLTIEERRGIELRLRVEIDEPTFISVYYSNLTEKKSYALVRGNNRIFGYDNSRFWHCHPVENPQEHVARTEPSPDQVFHEISKIRNLQSEI